MWTTILIVVAVLIMGYGIFRDRQKVRRTSGIVGFSTPTNRPVIVGDVNSSHPPIATSYIVCGCRDSVSRPPKVQRITKMPRMKSAKRGKTNKKSK